MILNTSDHGFANRIATFTDIATELALLSNKRLSNLLETATQIGTSIGGTASLLTLGNAKIFVKKIRLTDIERQPENIMSTRNIFNLPPYYQYGIGSAGFGVWRELATHTMATNWVLSTECRNFPLMYHWRLMPKSTLETPISEQLAELESDVKWWGGSPIVRARLLENLSASADIVIFLEHFPHNLHEWLSKQIFNSSDVAESACEMVDHKLKEITSYINSHGLLHFDAHFNNILTDGHDLYFSDFGLATCARFELSESELHFFKENYNYDQCYTVSYFVEWLLTESFRIENWAIGNYNAMLHEYATGNGKPLQPAIEKIVMRYLPIAIIMNEFFIKLKECKSTPYPTNELERAYNKLST